MNYPEIKKYLEGKTKGDKYEQIREWLTDPKNESHVRKILGEIWENYHIKLSGDKPDFDILLERIHYRLNTEKNKPTLQKTGKETYGKTIYRLFTKVAAILLLPLLILSAYLYFTPQVNIEISSEPSVREIYTKPGTRTKIELSDGTLVWLNDGTVLKYPEYFKGNNRQVFVDGEAYFEVKSNPEKPFIVNNPIMKTIVTGTHFNIYAYSSDNFFEATLLEGKIHLEGQAGNIDVLPGQRIQFDVISKRFARDEIEPENAVKWIDGRLIIHNERLESAIKKLSRWYNVPIVINDPELNLYELTCTFENEKIEQCMNLISHALPIKYIFKAEKTDNNIHQKIELIKK